MSEPLTAAQLAQAARLLARTVVAGASELLEQLAQTEPTRPAADRPEAVDRIIADVLRATDITLEITDVDIRPRAAGQPVRVAITCRQLGPLGVRTFVVYDTLPFGFPNPYQVGQHYRVTLQPVGNDHEQENGA
jgi:hypothetical protein